jgi:Na+/H+-translocating membrane pyrophosphatase
VLPISSSFLPARFHIGPLNSGWQVTPNGAFSCIAAGLWAGCSIGFVTGYYAREVETGAASNIINGLAPGYKSCIIPIFLISSTVFIAFCTCLTINVYNHASGIAEMAELPESIRGKSHALDAAGNTTAAIGNGKGFAIGFACLVALIFGGFVTRAGLETTGSNIIKPTSFCFLLIYAMALYWLTAMIMKSVGVAAMEMAKEVKFQFTTIRGLLEGTPGHGPPGHARCIKSSTDLPAHQRARITRLPWPARASHTVLLLLLSGLVGQGAATTTSCTGNRDYIEPGTFDVATTFGFVSGQRYVAAAAVPPGAIYALRQGSSTRSNKNVLKVKCDAWSCFAAPTCYSLTSCLLAPTWRVLI